jgi:3-oxoacyl-[acyl-carrier protein] reductase
MNQSFANKKIFITGASRGIGREIAKEFRSRGGYVIGTRTSDSVSTDDGYCNQWFSADFANMDEIINCAEFLKKSSIDILINNAGINKNASFIDIKIEDFNEIQKVNLTAPFLLCQAAIPAMKRKKWGRIINISSIWGKISMTHRAAYSASKFAIDGMTLALSAEFAADGIMANSIAPGFINTELTRKMLNKAEIANLIAKVPIQRLGETSEIAKFVLWLSSEENTFISGQNIAIDGGFSRV